MQMRDTFPELSAGRSKRMPARRASAKGAPGDLQRGMAGFVCKPPRPINAPRSLSGRRAAAQRKAGRG